MRLIDRILSGQTQVIDLAGEFDKEIGDDLIRVLGDVRAAVDASTVYQYMRERGGIGPSDFPNLTPPWSSFWIEGGYGADAAAGTLFETSEGSEWPTEWNPEQGPPMLSAPSARFSMRAYTLIWRRCDNICHAAYDCLTQIDEAGLWIPETARAYFPPEMEPDQLGRYFFFCSLCAITFMHCRNARLVERAGNRAERRLAAREHRRQPVRYHVLEVDAIKRILDETGAAKKFGLKHALHICRGHFKTYTAEAPLFGKIVGHWFWPMHVRGDSERGVVLKSYQTSDIDAEASP